MERGLTLQAVRSPSLCLLDPTNDLEIPELIRNLEGWMESLCKYSKRSQKDLNETIRITTIKLEAFTKPNPTTIPSTHGKRSLHRHTWRYQTEFKCDANVVFRQWDRSDLHVGVRALVSP